MNLVICKITVAVVVGGLTWFDKTEVEGVVISSNAYSYVVDFTAQAKKHQYVGSYSSRIVSKKDCVPK